MYHCIEYLYSHGKVFRTIVADNGTISHSNDLAMDFLGRLVVSLFSKVSAT